MRKEDCFQLGHVSRLHGLKGEVILHLDTDQPEAYENLGSVFFLQGGTLVPFFLEEAHLIKKQQLRIKVEDVTTIQQAEALIGLEAYLPADVLPPLDGKAFYYHEIIGFQVEDQSGTALGTVLDVLDNPGQDLLKVEHSSGKEILLPLVDELLLDLNRSTKTLHIQLPEGLLDLYL